MTTCNEKSDHTRRTARQRKVVRLILRLIKSGLEPWEVPRDWHAAQPRNLVTGRRYKGLTAMLLKSRLFSSPFWLAEEDIKASNAKIKDGEEGMMVSMNDKQPRPDAVVGKPARTTFQLRGRMLYNVLQVEGIDHPEMEKRSRPVHDERFEAVEDFIARLPSGPRINAGRSVTSGYDASRDAIDIPAFDRFENAESYYLRLLHEIVRSTGHPTRLYRPTGFLPDAAGAADLAMEETAAELGAALLAEEFGVAPEWHTQSAAYIQQWISQLEESEIEKHILQASVRALKAVHFLHTG